MKGEYMEQADKSRRTFVRNAALVGGIAAYGVVTATAVMRKQVPDYNNGVIIGESNKKEVLYHDSIHWQEYYKHAV